jgi:hypothetical protein
MPDVYEGFNILLRRKAKENNFKAVLETVRYAPGASPDTSNAHMLVAHGTR